MDINLANKLLETWKYHEEKLPGFDKYSVFLNSIHVDVDNLPNINLTNFLNKKTNVTSNEQDVTTLISTIQKLASKKRTANDMNDKNETKNTKQLTVREVLQKIETMESTCGRIKRLMDSTVVSTELQNQLENIHNIHNHLFPQQR